MIQILKLCLKILDSIQNIQFSREADNEQTLPQHLYWGNSMV